MLIKKVCIVRLLLLDIKLIYAKLIKLVKSISINGVDLDE